VKPIDQHKRRPDDIGPRVTSLRTEALALLDDVVRRPGPADRRHPDLVSHLQDLANDLGTLQALASSAPAIPAPIDA
jgi:hypothetical protein